MILQCLAVLGWVTAVAKHYIKDRLAKARATRTSQAGRTRPWAIAMISPWPKASSSAMIGAPSRQAYQALKSLATHKTDRSDAPGLAHLARTGFFKPVQLKSLQAHALRSLISARKKLVGQRVTLENQIRGLAVVFRVRLPRALATGPITLQV
jgi:Transposase